MVMAGGAVATACRVIAKRAARIGGRLLQTDPAQPSTRAKAVGPHGSVSWVGRDRARLVSAAAGSPADVDPGGLEATIGYKPARDSGTFSYATHAALVAVDPEIGDVEILDYVIVEDGGKLVNPMIADGQIYGGFAKASVPRFMRRCRSIV